jgi:serine/threonine protein kinase
MCNPSFVLGLPSDADWTAAKDIQVGRRLTEEYEVGEMIGEGAYGVVYAARHREAGTTVAVKLVDKVETPIAQIRKEAELLQAVQHHECVVRFHGVFFEQCFACLVMDMYSGGALIDGLHRHMKRKGKIECLSVAHISFQMATALCYIHGRNIAHRDVKGDNFLMDRKDIDDPECRIALTDFGSSTYVPHGERFSDEVGTRRFWAPEIFKRDYGPKVDIWAMGVTMYGLLKGSFPFKDDEEVCTKNWELNFPRVDSTCKDYLRAMLTRDEKARASSEEIMAHKWVDNGRGTAADAIQPAPSPYSGDLLQDKPRCASEATATMLAPVIHVANVQEKGEGMRNDLDERPDKAHANADMHHHLTAKEESQRSWEKWSKIAARSRWIGETLKFEWWGDEQEDACEDIDESSPVAASRSRTPRGSGHKLWNMFAV